MPITPHIEAVAKRTIEGIQDYYCRFSDDINDTDEMEHRIARIERLKDACNGYSDKDKLQKTAENLFEVGTAWERGQDVLKTIIRTNQAYVEQRLDEIEKSNSENYEHLQESIKELSDNMLNKLDDERKYNDTHYEYKSQLSSGAGLKNALLKFIDAHFSGVLFGVIFIIVLLFISGQTDLINQIIGKF